MIILVSLRAEKLVLYLVLKIWYTSRLVHIIKFGRLLIYKAVKKAVMVSNTGCFHYNVEIIWLFMDTSIQEKKILIILREEADCRQYVNILSHGMKKWNKPRYWGIKICFIKQSFKENNCHLFMGQESFSLIVFIDDLLCEKLQLELLEYKEMYWNKAR